MIDAQARSERLHQQTEAKLSGQLKEITGICSLGVPSQVLLRRPVTFLDARGRVAPVHLDFITCAEVTPHVAGRLEVC
jgi:hypothetical protein